MRRPSRYASHISKPRGGCGSERERVYVRETESEKGVERGVERGVGVRVLKLLTERGSYHPCMIFHSLTSVTKNNL